MPGNKEKSTHNNNDPGAEGVDLFFNDVLLFRYFAALVKLRPGHAGGASPKKHTGGYERRVLLREVTDAARQVVPLAAKRRTDLFPTFLGYGLRRGYPRRADCHGCPVSGKRHPPR